MILLVTRFLLAFLLACSLLSEVKSSLNLADVPCGKSARGSRRFHAKIMGGSPVPITEFAHAVSLRKNGKHYCGGALIHKQYVMTAAHCLHSYPTEVWSVSIGDQDTSGRDENEQQFEVEQILKHPQYQFPNFTFDLALMKLSKPVLWSKYAQPVCLPEASHTTGKGLGFLAGWGANAEGGEPTKDLHLVKLPIIENEQCQEWFDSQGKNITMQSEHLCAGYEQGKEDGCQGDSGGGLVSLDDDDKLVLVGVMSAGIGCGREKLPGVYTRVEKFVSWVEGIVGKGTLEQGL